MERIDLTGRPDLTLGIDPGLKNLGFCILNSDNLLIDAGVVNVNGRNVMDTVNRSVDWVKQIKAKYFLERVYIERQPPGRFNRVQSVAIAIYTTFRVFSVPVELVSPVVFGKSLSYRQRKQSAIEKFRTCIQDCEKSQNAIQHLSKSDLSHVADAYHIAISKTTNYVECKFVL